MKQSILLVAISVWGFIACDNASDQNADKKQTDTIANKVENNNEPIVYDNTIFPDQVAMTTKALTIGVFHEDEVWPNAEKVKWFGIFKNATSYYTAETVLKTKRVKDQMVDENTNKKTGWEVSTTNKDSCLFLVESLPILSGRSYQSSSLSTNQILPGNVVKFKYLGIDYELMATGDKKPNQNDPNTFEISNYKLYLSATIKGQLHKSLLSAQQFFDGTMITIIFSGDIDGDGIVDLIIDNSNKYSSNIPTLYLSKSATNGEVVKPVGAHRRVG